MTRGSSALTCAMRDARCAAGKTMGDVARALGVTVPRVSTIERGKVPEVTPDERAAIAALLDMSADVLERCRQGCAAKQRTWQTALREMLGPNWLWEDDR
jgi:transcriptional regulator with XRE-family HTH domain